MKVPTRVKPVSMPETGNIVNHSFAKVSLKIDFSYRLKYIFKYCIVIITVINIILDTNFNVYVKKVLNLKSCLEIPLYSQYRMGTFF